MSTQPVSPSSTHEPSSSSEVSSPQFFWGWLASPYVLFLTAFLVVPFLNLAVLSVYTHSATSIWVADFTLANYINVFTDSYYVDIALRTLKISSITTVLCVVLGYPIAYFLARCSPKVLAVGLFLLVMPLMISTVIRSFGWMVILGRNGPVASFLSVFGLPSNFLYTEVAVVLALVESLLPMAVMPLMASIERISTTLEEAAANLGAGPLQRFFRVLLPLSNAGIISGSVLCFTVSVSVVVTPALLGGRSGRMMGNEIYDQVMSGINWPFAASLSILLIVLVFVVITLSSAMGARVFRRSAVP